MNFSKALLKLIPFIQKSESKQNLNQHLSPEHLEKILQLDTDTTTELDAVYRWIDKYIQYSVNTSHPFYNNRMWSQANIPSMLGDTVKLVTNTSGCSYETAPVASVIEKYLIATLNQMVGFEQGGGLMVSGSSHANLIAMLIARNRVNAKTQTKGLANQKPLVAFVSTESHYSLDKAANIIGIGCNNLIKVAVNRQGQMDAIALEQGIKQQLSNGKQPFFVCATLGTTVRGAFDPIAPIAAVCQQYQLYLHADGAWGGACLFSDTLRAEHLQNLDLLDSLTIDFHKILNSALLCNVFLTKQANATKQALNVGNTEYIFHNEYDIGMGSLQCGRSVDSLKLFLDWKYFGKTGFAKKVETANQRIQYAKKQIEQIAELVCVSCQPLNICFYYQPQNSSIDLEALNKNIRKSLLEQGISMLSTGYIDGQLIFRLLVVNENFQEEHIDQLLNYIVKTGNQLLKNLK